MAIKDKAVIITGASSGIGAATATSLFKNSGNTAAGSHFASMSPDKVAELMALMLALELRIV